MRQSLAGQHVVHSCVQHMVLSGPDIWYLRGNMMECIVFIIFIYSGWYI